MNYFYNDDIKKVHNKSLPFTFRMLIVGQSGCGKTTLLMQILLEDNFLNYDKLYVFARSLHQPEYQCLEEGFKNQLPKADIIALLNAGKLIETGQSLIKDVALGLRLDSDKK